MPLHSRRSYLTGFAQTNNSKNIFSPCPAAILLASSMEENLVFDPIPDV
jgi:hypothetical protein